MMPEKCFEIGYILCQKMGEWRLWFHMTIQCGMQIKKTRSALISVEVHVLTQWTLIEDFFEWFERLYGLDLPHGNGNGVNNDKVLHIHWLLYKDYLMIDWIIESLWKINKELLYKVYIKTNINHLEMYYYSNLGVFKWCTELFYTIRVRTAGFTFCLFKIKLPGWDYLFFTYILHLSFFYLISSHSPTLFFSKAWPWEGLLSMMNLCYKKKKR